MRQCPTRWGTLSPIIPRQAQGGSLTSCSHQASQALSTGTARPRRSSPGPITWTSGAEDLAWIEEPGDLRLGVVDAVGRVDDILHHLSAEVAADRALRGLAGIGRP